MSASSSTSPDARRPKGTLLVVSGPSGVGKSSVIDGVLEQTGAGFSVSATTRDARPDEVHGEDYLFVSDDEFDRLVADDELLEWAEYGGYRYGTPRRPVLEMLEAGDHVVLDIENLGAHQVKAAYPEAVLVFILPPSTAELERRLRARGDTSESDIERRLSVAAQQIADATTSFDHLAVNDELETAISQVTSILGARIPANGPVDAPGDHTEE